VFTDFDQLKNFLRQKFAAVPKPELTEPVETP
jgi:hypothetical protein